VAIYPSQPSETSLGLFCKAKDAALNNKLLDNANLSAMYEFVAAYKSIGLAFLVAIGLGVLGVFGFSFIPGIMAYTTIILGGIGSIVFAIYLLASDSGYVDADKGYCRFIEAWSSSLA
jgi:polyferredoxin